MIGTWYLVPMILGPVIGVIGTVFGAFLANRAARRTTSGTVETSNATELWNANNRIIDGLRADIDRLRKDVDGLRNEVATVRQERDQLMRENGDLRVKLHDLELEMVRLRAGQAMQAVTTTTVSTTKPEPPGA